MKTVTLTINPPYNKDFSLAEPKVWWATEGPVEHHPTYGDRPSLNFLNGAPFPKAGQGEARAEIEVEDDVTVVAGCSWLLKKKDGGDYTAKLRLQVNAHAPHARDEFGVISASLEMR